MELLCCCGGRLQEAMTMTAISRRVYPLLLLVVSSACMSKSDLSLRSNYFANERAFDQLRNMLFVDTGILSINASTIITPHATLQTAQTDSSIWREAGVTRERFVKYITLFHQLGLEAGVARDSRGLWFRSESPSFFNGDTTKGYFYSFVAPQPLAKTLDHYVPAPNELDSHGSYVVFEALKDHWYLYAGRN